MQSKMKEIEVFISYDGKEFLDEESCIRHEELLEAKQYLEDNPIASWSDLWHFRRTFHDILQQQGFL